MRKACFQFSLRALLVAMLVVAAFFGGMAVQRQIDERKYDEYKQWRAVIDGKKPPQ